MLFRAVLVAASIASGAIGPAALAGADPHCAPGQCAGTPAQSPSYQDGYYNERSFYSEPRNHTFLKNEMQQDGLDTTMVCEREMTGGPQPPNSLDWIRGCIDALHELGLKP
jgi:hypothetical protein